MIAALDRNGGIGNNGQLLVRIPEDLARFRQLTLGHHLVMGRKTYDSIGGPLPGRICHVLTRGAGDQSIDGEQTVAVRDMQTIIERHAATPEQTLFVIGGGEIYALFLPLASELLLTRIDAEFPADAFFPQWSLDEWQLVESSETKLAKIDDCRIAYRFERYRRTKFNFF